MRFISHAYTDIGIKKSVNQDSALIVEAKTKDENIIFCVLCDGMGGLEDGEFASAVVIKAFAKWIEEKFPIMYYNRFDSKMLEKVWSDILFEQNIKLMTYSREKSEKLMKDGIIDRPINTGTTVVSLLICGGKYYVMNIGDSRAYIHNGKLSQITEDQTFVNREIKLGNMTPEQAENHPRRNVLLQCVGASQFIEPDFFYGDVKGEDVFILCSDGFRHMVKDNEIEKAFNPEKIDTELDIEKNEEKLVELNKERLETDNITVIGIKLFEK